MASTMPRQRRGTPTEEKHITNQKVVKSNNSAKAGSIMTLIALGELVALKGSTFITRNIMPTSDEYGRVLPLCQELETNLIGFCTSLINPHLVSQYLQGLDASLHPMF